MVLVEWPDDLLEPTAADMTADIDDFLVLVVVVDVVATEPLRLRGDDAYSVRFSLEAVARADVNEREGLRGRE